MKKLMITAAALASLCTSAATIEELNKIPIKEVTAANAIEVFDAAVAATNCGRITSLVTLNKVSLEDAVHKTMGKLPLKMCRAAFAGSTATNYILIAEAARAIDFTVAMNETETQSAREIVGMKGFVQNEPETAKAILADIYAKDKLFGAEMYCSFWNSKWREAFLSEGPAAYEAVKPLIKEKANTRQAAILWHYAIYWAHDYDGFNEIYDKKLVNPTWHWLYPKAATIPVVVQCMKDQLEVFKATLKPAKGNNDIFLRVSKLLDQVNKDKTATFGVIDYLATTKAKLAAALYCNDMDKVLEVLVACDTTLEAKDIEAALGPINALDPDYKPAEVLKALKAVNQRYTLKLYDDRDAWEPVLSKIRAMIDCR